MDMTECMVSIFAETFQIGFELCDHCVVPLALPLGNQAGRHIGLQSLGPCLEDIYN
jgi:hypothetical protein